jgi:hypothetical protein
MDYLYAFVGGLLCKAYDDFNDNHMIGSHVQELLKGSQWILLTLLSYNDFNFALVNYVINALNALNNWQEWKFSYESSLLVLAPVFLLVSFHTVKYFSMYDWVYLVVFILSMALEPLIIKEEFSYRKLVVRLIALINSIFGVIFGVYLGVSPSLVKISCYATGYFLFSSGFQTYLLMRSPVHLLLFAEKQML